MLVYDTSNKCSTIEKYWPITVNSKKKFKFLNGSPVLYSYCYYQSAVMVIWPNLFFINKCHIPTFQRTVQLLKNIDPFTFYSKLKFKLLYGPSGLYRYCNCQVSRGGHLTDTVFHKLMSYSSLLNKCPTIEKYCANFFCSKMKFPG